MSSMPGLEKSVESVSAFLVSPPPSGTSEKVKMSLSRKMFQPVVSFRFVKKSSDRQLLVQTDTSFSSHIGETRQECVLKTLTLSSHLLFLIERDSQARTSSSGTFGKVL